MCEEQLMVAIAMTNSRGLRVQKRILISKERTTHCIFNVALDALCEQPHKDLILEVQ